LNSSSSLGTGMSGVWEALGGLCTGSWLSKIDSKISFWERFWTSGIPSSEESSDEVSELESEVSGVDLLSSSFL